MDFQLVDDKFLLALSGGVDSLVLFHKLKEKVTDITNFHVVHFNHKLRKESDLEYIAMKELCELNEVKFHGIDLDVDRYMKDNNVSMETGARELRYRHFKKISEEYGINHIYLGHHGDDLVETVFMRIVKSSHQKGLIGMSLENTVGNLTYHRPLLNYTKDEIVKEAKTKGYMYFTDSSNNDEKITRNRYRKNLLPFLKEENNKVHEAVFTFSQEKKEDENFFDLMVKDFMCENTKYYRCLVGFEKTALNGTHVALRKRVFKKLVQNVMGDNYMYSNLLLDNVLSFINSNTTSKAVEISKDFYIVSDHKLVWFFDKADLDIYVEDNEFTINSQNLIKKTENHVRINGKKLSKLYSELKVSPFFRDGYVAIQNDEVVNVYNIFGDLIR